MTNSSRQSSKFGALLRRLFGASSRFVDAPQCEMVEPIAWINNLDVSLMGTFLRDMCVKSGGTA